MTASILLKHEWLLGNPPIAFYGRAHPSTPLHVVNTCATGLLVLQYAHVCRPTVFVAECYCNVCPSLLFGVPRGQPIYCAKNQIYHLAISSA